MAQDGDDMKIFQKVRAARRQALLIAGFCGRIETLLFLPDKRRVKEELEQLNLRIQHLQKMMDDLMGKGDSTFIPPPE